jgi:hypothetical protein
MSDENQQESVSNAQIMLSIGKLVGTMEAVNTSISAIRTDIQRLDQTSSDRLARVEDNLVDKIKDQGVTINKRIDVMEKTVGENISGLSTRVTALEAEDKKIIKDVAKMSAMGGGIGGALVAAAVEIIKHIPN